KMVVGVVMSVIVISIWSSASATNDTVLTIKYNGTRITFSRSNLVTFYVCLCNKVRSPCLARSEKKFQNVSEVDINIVSGKYAGESEDNLVSTCKVGEDKSGEFLINCTKVVHSKPVISIHFSDVTKKLNDTCVGSFVNIELVNARLMSGSPDVIISNETSQITGSERPKISTKEPVLSHDYIIIMAVLLTMSCACIAIFVLLSMLRHKGWKCMNCPLYKNTTSANIKNEQPESHYAFIDDICSNPPTKYSGLRNISRNIQHTYNTSNASRKDVSFDSFPPIKTSRGSSNNSLSVVEIYNVASNVTGLPDKTDQNSSFDSTNNNVYSNDNSKFDPYYEENLYKTPKCQLEDIDSGPNYSVVNLNE
ncbi:hypothetical protein BgiMline_026279, partial [Biomphalaria glabrata]